MVLAFYILPFVVSYLMSMIIIIYDVYDIYDDIGQIDPYLPFQLFYYIITFKPNIVNRLRHNFVQRCLEDINNSCILAINYWLTMISWMIASIFGPIISLFGLFNNEIRIYSICYQLLLILPSTMFHFCAIDNIYVYC